MTDEPQRSPAETSKIVAVGLGATAMAAMVGAMALNAANATQGTTAGGTGTDPAAASVPEADVSDSLPSDGSLEEPPGLTQLPDVRLREVPTSPYDNEVPEVPSGTTRGSS